MLMGLIFRMIFVLVVHPLFMTLLVVIGVLGLVIMINILVGVV